MAARTDFNQVHDVLDQLHQGGVVNLDKSVREMLAPKEALGRLSPGSNVADSVIAWDGYAIVIAGKEVDLAALATVAQQLRGISGEPG
jgi:hypothetical protein